MSVLVVAEHDNRALKPATLNAVTAASEIAKAAGGDVHILVAGKECRPVAEAATQVAGVAKVLLADDAAYEHGIAENLAPLIVKLAANYSHVLAPATTSGKNLMPRVAALLDVMQISDISAFLHFRVKETMATNRVPGDYALEKLLTGDAKAGLAYFNGAGGCVGCHSPKFLN